MVETVTQIQSAPDYLKPGIERFLEGATAQAGQALDTSKFAPQVVGLGALQQQAQQQAATQAGLGTLQFDPTTGAVSGVTGAGVAGFEPFLQTAQQTIVVCNLLLLQRQVGQDQLRFKHLSRHINQQ